MGLGPPVCTDCKMRMRFNEKYPHWTCAKCNKNGHTDEGVSPLFCLTDEELKEYDENSGTDMQVQLLKYRNLPKT